MIRHTQVQNASALALMLMTWIHAPALAQAPTETTTYVGIGAGMAEYDWRNPQPAFNGKFCGLPTLTKCEDSPVGFKLFIGHNINSWLGIEGSYFNGGDAKIEFPMDVIVPPATTPVTATLSQRVTISGFAISAVATAPLGAAFLSGRLGVGSITTSRKNEVLGQQSLQERSRVKPVFGVGGGIHFGRNLSARLDWDRTRGVTSGNEAFNLDLYTVSVMYRFQ